MTNEDSLSNLPDSFSGYEEDDEFIVQEFRQGSRVHYSFVVSLVQCTQLFPKPDPDQPFDDNRQVSAARASLFATYVTESDGWHAGALTIRATSGLTSFDEIKSYGRFRLGKLRVPKGRSQEFQIVDGQHRILGLHHLLDGLAADRRNWMENKQLAERNEDKPALKTATDRLTAIEIIRKRVGRESILVNLILEDDSKSARQLFVDVADNAKGVPKAVRARFDGEKVVHRALHEVLDSPPRILDGRVDPQKDRVNGKNTNLLGAGTLADIIRILEVGISGRVSNRMEDELTDKALAKQAIEFFDTVTEIFPELTDVANNNVTCEELRRTSLLGSITMLRVLAGVVHEVRTKKNAAAAYSLLKKLSPHTAAPIDAKTTSGQLWLACGSTDAFADGALAPAARSQQVKDAVASISAWADAPPVLLAN